MRSEASDCALLHGDENLVLARETADGQLVKPGHVGTIYKAHNGRLAGRSSPRTLLLGPDGRALNGRALTKIRREERGTAYAERQLVEMGGPTRMQGESGESYVRRALATGPFRRVAHPGNLAYVWPLRRPRPMAGRAECPTITR